jgi:hypothetical protein
VTAGAAARPRQDSVSNRIVLDSQDPIRVFLDCDRCDFNYLRQSITYVNYVRDRKVAQVHVLVNTQGSASGREWTVNFIGLEDFEGISQEVVFSTSSTDTDHEERQEFARVFQLGMVRYVLETPMSRNLQVVYQGAPEEKAPARTEDDPWDLWVYRTGLSADIKGEELRDENSFDGFFSASRTTEVWKMGFNLFGEVEDQHFEFDDGSTFDSSVQSFALSSRIIKSIGEHWGWGIGASARRSSFLNLDPSARLAGAIEYNLFPYSQSAQRALTFSYFVGGMDLSYEEITILGETEETRFDHGFVVEFDAERPWGESGLDFEARSFLDDFDQHRIVLRGRLDYRVFRGFSVNLRGNYALISDQIYLAAEEQSIEDILVGNQALRTDSRYELRVGFRYTFGSIFNNIVNSRLSGRSGGYANIF